jgi:hypothetical protein
MKGKSMLKRISGANCLSRWWRAIVIGLRVPKMTCHGDDRCATRVRVSGRCPSSRPRPDRRRTIGIKRRLVGNEGKDRCEAGRDHRGTGNLNRVVRQRPIGSAGCGLCEEAYQLSVGQSDSSQGPFHSCTAETVFSIMCWRYATGAVNRDGSDLCKRFSPNRPKASETHYFGRGMTVRYVRCVLDIGHSDTPGHHNDKQQ